jgi:hypothetical protein
MNSLEVSIEHLVDNAQARLDCAVYDEQYFRAGGALTSDYGFILFWKDYEVRFLHNRVRRRTEMIIDIHSKTWVPQLVAYEKRFFSDDENSLAELLGWAAIAAAGLAMLLSALWTLLRK